MSYKNQSLTADSFLPAHGGALNAAAEYFSIPREQWIDISTGINPNSWPVPKIPTSLWQRLPEEDHCLVSAAAHYYLSQCPAQISESNRVTEDNVLPCAGSQQGIRLLPLLYPAKKAAKVWLTSGSYSEHATAWQQQGHSVKKVACDRISQLLTQQPVDVLILVNPDNPSGFRWSSEQLLKWWKILHSRGGWLIVDEAFMDLTPEQSLAPYVEREGLFVLRSVGKYFGLAGVRLGFILSQVDACMRLKKMLGPWCISNPTQYIGQLALQDEQWISQQKAELNQQSQRLIELLKRTFSSPNVGTGLFRTLYFPQAESVFNQLAKQGVLTRFLPATSKSLPGLRFGLPENNESSWQKLESALGKIQIK